ncbi:MAG: hypothetical protein ACP5NU_01230 [Methanomicrobiales archaeon]
MVFWTVQTWWHYVDIYYPNPAKEVKQVVDIYTDQKEIPIDLSDIHCLGIKILARNSSNKEIAFVWDFNSQKVILNLELHHFPNAPIPYQYYKHVKIEISFLIVPFETYQEILSDNVSVQNNNNADSESEIVPNINYNYQQGPEIEDFFRDRRTFIDTYIWPKKIAHLYNDEPIQPEFDISLPKGWEIIENGWYYFYKVKWRNNKGEEKSEFEKDETPSVRWIDGQTRYNYLLKFNWDYYNPKSTEHEFEFHYVSQLTWPMVILSSIIPFGFFLFSFLILLFVDLQLFLPLVFSDAALLSLLVLLMSYLFAYLSFVKDGYIIPFQNRTAFIIIFALFIVVFTLICNQHPISHHFTIANLTNMSSNISSNFHEHFLNNTFNPFYQKSDNISVIVENDFNSSVIENIPKYQKMLIEISNERLFNLF